ncbi:MAG: response regulator [Bacteroidota bacterium]|nr:response regulator [Bacteroidota bacterium]
MKKVLVYDDDVDILGLCATILKLQGFDVLCKDNCKELITDIESYKPDVILMDNWLPDIGGVKAIQLIKSIEHLKQIPVVFFSANSQVEELAKEAGADYMLQKPFELDDLEKIIITAISA